MIYRSVPISELGDVVTGKTPSTSNENYYGSDYMFLGPKDLHKHFKITESEKMITESGLKSIKGSMLNGLSILVGCIGWDMGNVGLVEANCATNQQINSITNFKKGVNPFYVYYWLKGKKELLFQKANVTRTPILNKTEFSKIKINLPELSYQNKVANVLLKIDSKIELNNKINAELEAMAKLIYDYWFVQFDFPISPATAASIGKPELAGKPYKSSGGPMVYNQELKREIPEGWEVDTISSWFDHDKNGDWGKESAEGNYQTKVACVRGADLNGLNGTGDLKCPTRYILEKNEHKILSEGDIVVEISGGSPTQSTGRMAFITKETLERFETPLICSNFCKAATLKSNEDLFFFAYTWRRIYDNGILFGWEGKTSGIKNLLFDSFVTNHTIEKPNSELIISFQEFAEPMQAQIQKNLKQNQELSSLRDWLLPMLMNGQVTIKEAEEQFSMAAEAEVGYGK
ncbi:restriction endonuclease subunit S [uncultured Roseivirga sp.]|uniref:restriction endonuclease subunit S n=1 Tax=uncultured Roseivirga sp. TaxID=543088 RepID=UPI0030DA1A46|tara:strand:- start:761 stop:2140 length:1380 start_codon:yes stop_codon:yes gene_type:complete